MRRYLHARRSTHPDPLHIALRISIDCPSCVRVISGIDIDHSFEARTPSRQSPYARKVRFADIRRRRRAPGELLFQCYFGAAVVEPFHVHKARQGRSERGL
jgi:hypothetical protein